MQSVNGKTDQVRPSLNGSVFSSLHAGAHPSLLDLITMIPYRQQETLYTQGAPIQGLYLIREGLVKIARRMPDGKSRIISVARTGGMPHCFLSSAKHLTYCVALQPTRVAFIEREALRGWLEVRPQVTLSLLERVGHAAERGLREWTRSDYYWGIQGKLAHRLLRARRDFGISHHSGAVLIDLPLTRQEWADWIGHSREKTTKLLSDWRRREIVAFEGRKILVLQKDVLHKYASG